MSATMNTEHPGWHETSEGGAVRAVEYAGTLWSAHWTDESLVLRPVNSPDAEAPPVAYASAINLPAHPEVQPLVDELARLGTVQRLTNPSLWDAVATALLRQVVRAGQAKQVYRSFCSAYGQTVDTALGPLSVMPRPDSVLALSDAAFGAVGAAFSRDALRHAAEAYLDRGDAWRDLDADSLVQELVRVRSIGPWTAAAAAADFTGDHAVYPHGDLAVRTWARKAAPSLQLPSSDRELEGLWRYCAADRVALHTLTVFTLTWGNHARAKAHARSDR